MSYVECYAWRAEPETDLTYLICRVKRTCRNCPKGFQNFYEQALAISLPFFCFLNGSVYCSYLLPHDGCAGQITCMLISGSSRTAAGLDVSHEIMDLL